MRSKLSFAVAGALMALGLTGCGGEAEDTVDVAPEAPAGISVSDGRMNLPAVAGNPAAVYFTISNDGDTDKMILSAYVDGAESAMLHATSEWSRQVDMQELTQLPVPAGESVELVPGGDHVMAMNVDPALEPGGETEVTLTFVGGDKISFPVRLLAPGDTGE